jgi:FkbM family methyltransferase
MPTVSICRIGESEQRAQKKKRAAECCRGTVQPILPRMIAGPLPETSVVRRRVLELTRRVSRRFGIDLVRHDPMSSVGSRRQRILSSRDVTLVLDVGANVGQYASSLRAHGYAGRVLSFEPLSDAFAALAARAAEDPRWECVRTAIGDRDGEANVNVAGNSYSSSLLPMLDLHVANAPDSAYRGQQQVSIHRLDSLQARWSGAKERLFLKVDVQGLEKDVINGAPETLRHTVAVEAELSLAPLYQGQALFAEMVDVLDRAGFHLVSVEPGFADSRTGHLLQIDGIFARLDRCAT